VTLDLKVRSPKRNPLLHSPLAHSRDVCRAGGKFASGGVGQSLAKPADTIMVICRSGIRSAAANRLAEAATRLESPQPLRWLPVTRDPSNSGKLLWSVGPTMTFPRATESLLGNGKRSAGPSRVGLTMPNPRTSRHLEKPMVG